VKDLVASNLTNIGPQNTTIKSDVKIIKIEIFR
jgi:hypothetical protein